MESVNERVTGHKAFYRSSPFPLGRKKCVVDHGKNTAELGRMLEKEIRKKFPDGHIEIVYDHGVPNEGHQNILFVKESSRLTEISHADVVVVDKQAEKAIILCEIEEGGVDPKRSASGPKKIIGDLCSIFIADKLRTKGSEYTIDDSHLIFATRIRDDEDIKTRTKEFKAEIMKIVLPSSLRNIKIHEFICEPKMDDLIAITANEIRGVLGLPLVTN
jgi:hypothetical protein